MKYQLTMVLLFMPCLTLADACPTVPAAGTSFVTLPSPEGESLMKASRFKDDYYRLGSTLVTQQTQTLCSVASSVTVLNSLNIKRPVSPPYYPHNFFTQENFFSEAVSQVVPLYRVMEEGMTLAQIAQALDHSGVKAQVHHAMPGGEDSFRDAIKQILLEENRFVIINFLRTPVGQVGGGHFSPIAAYHEKTDQVLILDVARYKYPPAWVPLEHLYQAMRCPDSSSSESRGWIVVSAD